MWENVKKKVNSFNSVFYTVTRVDMYFFKVGKFEKSYKDNILQTSKPLIKETTPQISFMN